MNYDVVVIGGGIAGVTAAIYIKRGKKNVLLLESKTIGGQIIVSPKVENYPGYSQISGAALGMNLLKQIEDLNIDYKNEQVISIDGGDNNFTIKTNENEYHCKKVIIATGASSRTLGFEEKYIGKGVSFCATCDGAFFKNRNVLVVGGGNNAIEDAIYLSDICNKVYLVHRRDELKAEESKVQLLKTKENVEIITNAVLESINGDNNVESVIINQQGEKTEIDVNGIFICIGKIPNTNNINIDKDKNGYIITNDNMETSIKGIYAAGDVRAKQVRQLTTAASDGTISAMKLLSEL